MLTPQQLKQLKTLKTNVIVPRFVPPGYKLTRFETQMYPAGKPGGGGASYTLLYTCFCGGRFVVEGTKGGIGSYTLTPETTEEIFNIILGVIPLNSYRSDEGISYGTDWFERWNFFYAFEGSKMPRSDAEKIVKNLIFLKP